MPTILIAEPDKLVRTETEAQLQQEGFRVVSVGAVQSIVTAARESLPDVAVISLDFMEISGLDICNQLRLQPHLTHLPVMFITAEKGNTVVALEAGGDELMVKPFEVREFVARVRALVRRTQRLNQLNELRLDVDASQAWVNEQEVNLTPTEFSLLAYLCEHKTEFHSADALLATVWSYPNASGDTALVRNHIHNIREKLEKNTNRPQIIVSLHGRGYGINALVDFVQQQQHHPQNQDVHA